MLDALHYNIVLSSAVLPYSLLPTPYCLLPTPYILSYFKNICHIFEIFAFFLFTFRPICGIIGL